MWLDQPWMPELEPANRVGWTVDRAANTSQIHSLHTLIAARPSQSGPQVLDTSAPLLIPLKGAAATGDTGDMGMFCMDYCLQ